MAKSRGKAVKGISRRNSVNLIFIAAVLIIFGAIIYLNRLTNAVNVTANQARTADSFVDSIGINANITKTSWTTTSGTTINDIFGTITKPRLQELGVRHIRTGMTSMTPDTTTDAGPVTEITRLNELNHPSSTSGYQPIYPNILVSPSNETSNPTNSCFVPKLKWYMIGGPTPCGTSLGSVTSNLQVENAELPNEQDHWASYFTTCQSGSWYDRVTCGRPGWDSNLVQVAQALKTDLASSSVFANIKIIGASLVHINDTPTYQSITVNGTTLYDEIQNGVVKNSDLGNDHTYCSNRPLSYCYSSKVTPWVTFFNKPLIVTEAGYSSPSWVSNTVEAKYLGRGLFDYFDKGIKRTYIYSLMDDPTRPTTVERSFGILNQDGTPKVAYTYLENIISLLKDPGAPFTPGTLNYGFSTTSTTPVNATLLEKRDGSFYIVLRNETTSSTDTDVNASVTVSFGESVQSVDLYDPQTSTSIQHSFGSASSVTLNVPDRIIILKVVPSASTVSPTPTTTTSPTPTPTSTASPTPTPTATPTPTPGTPIHSGNLDGAAITSGSKWDASVTITVLDNANNPVPGVVVQGSWNRGAVLTGSCTTNSSGQCAIQSSDINTKFSVSFSVNNLSASSYSYDSAANSDPDGDSNGTTITVQPTTTTGATQKK